MTKRTSQLAVLIGCILGLSISAAGQTTRPAKPDVSAEQLDQAIAAMRRVDPGQLTDAQQQAKAVELHNAWATIVGAGDKGIARLKAELSKLETSKEKDDLFKLGAAALLWQLGKLEQADAIAAIWNSTPVHVQYNYTFYTAFEAARTQDEKALPMLEALLKDAEGRILVAQHSMNVSWPLTHEFLWGAFGPKGPPALERVLQRTKDPVAQKSGMLLLAQAQYLPALEKIRQLASNAKGEVRCVAIRCLGVYGHPNDYEFLLSALASKDTEEVWSCLYALYEYEDLRAVPHIAAQLKSRNERIQAEAFACVTHLLSCASLDAIHEYAQTVQGAKAKECKEFLDAVMDGLNLDWKAYSGKTPEQRAALLAGLRQQAEDQYRLRKDDRRLTHEQLAEAAAEWKGNHRLSGEKYGWVERHVLSAATSKDIELLLDVRAALYVRLSDECLYEVRSMDEVIRRLGRSRYRQNPGLCEKVEPAGPATQKASQ